MPFDEMINIEISVIVVVTCSNRVTIVTESTRLPTRDCNRYNHAAYPVMAKLRPGAATSLQPLSNLSATTLTRYGLDTDSGLQPSHNRVDT